MQKLLIGILTLTTVALAVFCAVQSRELRDTRQQLRTAEDAQRSAADAREAQSSRVKELERVQVRLEKQIEDFTSAIDTLRSNENRQATTVAALSHRMNAANQKAAAAANGEEEKGGGIFGKGVGQMISTMMKDPSMREMLRDQQSAAVKMMFSGLFKEMNLTPEEKEKLTSVLTDVQMKTLENTQMFGGTNSSAAGKGVSDAKKQADAEIKALLGEERFNQYQDYQKNIGERMQVDQLKASLAGQNMPLNDQQSSQLFQIMKEEKTALPPAIPNDANQDPAKMKELMTAENVEKQLQWMEDYNARVLARVQQILTPEQLKQYKTYQEQQASMAKFGMKMAREMFGGEKTAPPAK